VQVDSSNSYDTEELDREPRLSCRPLEAVQDTTSIQRPI